MIIVTPSNKSINILYIMSMLFNIIIYPLKDILKTLECVIGIINRYTMFYSFCMYESAVEETLKATKLFQKSWRISS